MHCTFVWNLWIPILLPTTTRGVSVILVCMEREKLWFIPSVFMRVANFSSGGDNNWFLKEETTRGLSSCTFCRNGMKENMTYLHCQCLRRLRCRWICFGAFRTSCFTRSAWAKLKPFYSLGLSWLFRRGWMLGTFTAFRSKFCIVFIPDVTNPVQFVHSCESE